MSPYCFLHCSSGRSSPTDDPHTWLLHHRDDGLLAAARERLVLSSDDPARCLRVVLRRCHLALIQIVSDMRVVVRHWSDPAPDLRRWAKEYGWNRLAIQVMFTNVKNNKVVVHENAEDILLYGVRVGPKFPWPEYTERYEQREVNDAEDEGVAPAAFTNFAWDGVPAERLTWKVLKAIWNAERVECPNCDMPLMLTSAAWHPGPLSFRSSRVVRHCLGCRRRFEAADEEPLAWIASVLPPPLRPTHLRLWDTIAINWPRLSLIHHRPVQFVDRER